MTKASPEMGGCWFCRELDDALTFDTEFDTAVHVTCIRKALEENPDNYEAQAMEYLLEESEE